MTVKKSARFKILALLTSSAIVFYAISGLSALFNYAFYPAISRLVSVDAYGEIQFLVSSFNQLAVGFVVLNILAIILSVRAQSNEEKNEKIHSLNRVAGLVASTLATVGVVVLIVFMEQLQLTDPLSVVLLGVALLINVPLTTLIGQLQGSGKFIAAGLVGLVAAVAKLGFSLAFVVIGLGTTGAVLGLVAGMATAIALGVLFLDKKKIKRSSLSIKKHALQLSHVRQQAFVGLLTISLLTLLSTIDIIGSRIVLSSVDAGLYAVVASLAKIIIAIGSPLMWLVLPFAVDGNVKKIVRYVIIATIASSVLVVIFFISPRELVTLFMGVDAGVLASLLPVLGISMTLYSLSFILFAALICTDRLRFVTTIFTVLSVLVLSIFIIVPLFYSFTLEHFIYIQLSVGALLVITGLYGLLPKFGKRKVQAQSV